MLRWRVAAAGVADELHAEGITMRTKMLMGLMFALLGVLVGCAPAPAPAPTGLTVGAPCTAGGLPGTIGAVADPTTHAFYYVCVTSVHVKASVNNLSAEFGQVRLMATGGSLGAGCVTEVITCDDSTSFKAGDLIHLTVHQGVVYPANITAKYSVNGGPQKSVGVTLDPTRTGSVDIPVGDVGGTVEITVEGG